MVRGGFRHLIVLENGETVGILSVRDVVRCWTDDGAICPVPASAAAGVREGWHACSGEQACHGGRAGRFVGGGARALPRPSARPRRPRGARATPPAERALS